MTTQDKEHLSESTDMWKKGPEAMDVVSEFDSELLSQPRGSQQPL